MHRINCLTVHKNAEKSDQSDLLRANAQKYIKAQKTKSKPMAFRYKRKHARRGRIPKTINIAKNPVTEGLTPLSKSARALYVGSARTIYIDPAEIEAQRLVDLEGLLQKQAGERMGVSRGTVWRLLQAARKKTAQCISEGRPLLILDERNTRVSEESNAPSRPNQEY